MTLFFIVGKLGSGKTLLMTFLAFINPKRTIYSNYSLFFNRKLWKIKDFDLSVILTEGYNPSLILIDEAYNYFEARLSSSIENILGSDVLFQSRKKGMDIYLTLQELRTIDIRFRELVDIYIECQKLESHKCFRYVIYSEDTTSVMLIPFSLAERIYKLYDTYEVVVSERTKEMMLRFESTEDRLERINENIPIFLDWLDEMKIGKPNDENISLFCEINKLPKNRVFKKLFKLNVLKHLKISVEG